MRGSIVGTKNAEVTRYRSTSRSHLPRVEARLDHRRTAALRQRAEQAERPTDVEHRDAHHADDRCASGTKGATIDPSRRASTRRRFIGIGFGSPVVPLVKSTSASRSVATSPTGHVAVAGEQVVGAEHRALDGLRQRVPGPRRRPRRPRSPRPPRGRAARRLELHVHQRGRGTGAERTEQHCRRQHTAGGHGPRHDARMRCRVAGVTTRTFATILSTADT